VNCTRYFVHGRAENLTNQAITPPGEPTPHAAPEPRFRMASCFSCFNLRSNVEQDAILVVSRPEMDSATGLERYRKPSSFNSRAPPRGSFSARCKSIGSMKRL
jgi:hypothetical protein